MKKTLAPAKARTPHSGKKRNFPEFFYFSKGPNFGSFLPKSPKIMISGKTHILAQCDLLFFASLCLLSLLGVWAFENALEICGYEPRNPEGSRSLLVTKYKNINISNTFWNIITNTFSKDFEHIFDHPSFNLFFPFFDSVFKSLLSFQDFVQFSLFCLVFSIMINFEYFAHF